MQSEMQNKVAMDAISTPAMFPILARSLGLHKGGGVTCCMGEKIVTKRVSCTGSKTLRAFASRFEDYANRRCHLCPLIASIDFCQTSVIACFVGAGNPCGPRFCSREAVLSLIETGRRKGARDVFNVSSTA